MEKVIEKIHKEFKTCANKTLKDSQKFANGYKPIEAKQSADVDFLKSIGFGNVDFVREQDNFNANAVEKNFQDGLKLENEKALSDRILELKKLYPNYSVVTEDTVKTICNKYGLVFASSKFYTGTIPNKNITDLLNFTKNVIIDEKNKLYFYWDNEETYWLDRRFKRKKINEFIDNHLSLFVESYNSDKSDYDVWLKAYFPKYCGAELFNNVQKAEEIRIKNRYSEYHNDEAKTDEYKFYLNYRKFGTIFELNNFFITAPSKDFDFGKFNRRYNSDEVNNIVYAKNNEILSKAANVKGITEINDPVILRHVFGYEHKSAESSKHYINTEIKPLFLLVTLWGIEKYDPLLNNTDPIYYN